MIAFLAELVPPAVEAAEVDPVFGSLMVAIILLALAFALIAIEFVVVSGGLLGIAALASAVAAVVYAFAAGPLAGWVFTILTPILGVIAIKSGLKWMSRSRMVVQAEISDDAGYRHALGDIAVGSQGALVTDAYPSGRARFTTATGTREIDVQLRGGVSAEAGAQVSIKAIDGPVVFCDLHATPSPAIDPKGTP